MTNQRSFSFDTSFPRLATEDANGHFGEFEQILVANSGEDAFDVAIKLLAAKIQDELQAKETGTPRRFMTALTPGERARDAEHLLAQAAKRWQGILDFNGGFKLSAEQLSLATRPLVGWDILSTSFHHLDALLERLVARGSKGALGQYFTPRPVIRMCVAALQPSSTDSVIDPACGSGGFLFEALDYANPSRKDGGPQCLGIDYSEKSLRVASLLSVAAGKTFISLHKGNAVDGRSYVNQKIPEEWKRFVTPQAGEKRRWGDWSRLRGSIVLTNPPFAGDIEEAEVLDAYDSQTDRGASRKATVGREHLFLERAVQLLSSNGRLAIVLPQGLLANSSASYLRSWLLRKTRVLGVVGLHPHTFLPHTGVKTSVLFVANEEPQRNDKILMLSSTNCGKDSRGRPVGKGDYEQLSKMLRQFLYREAYPWAAKEGGDEYREFVVSRSDVDANERLDAEYYSPTKRRTYQAARERAASSLLGCTNRKLQRFKKKDYNAIEYIDISSIDHRTGMPVPASIAAEEAPSRATTIVTKGDVLVSTVRPERNVVGYIYNQPEGVTVASSGFCVLRPTKEVPSELLFTFCKSELFKDLVTRQATASMYPAVTDSDVLGVPLVVPVGKEAEVIAKRVRRAMEQLEAARQDLKQAVEEMNSFHRKTLG